MSHLILVEIVVLSFSNQRFLLVKHILTAYAATALRNTDYRLNFSYLFMVL